MKNGLYDPVSYLRLVLAHCSSQRVRVPVVFEPRGRLGRNLDVVSPGVPTALPVEPVALPIGCGDPLTDMGRVLNYGVSVSNP